ncbi:hypothetical protein [Thermoflexibacter ruber]|uniref:hypothetical protein n=1 Tax=Thermoflexibacter ruber TaxID=1003 RepID=UPI0011602593|nr:hypothetical protein [Thermoflexibacter ruber]
MNRGGSWNNNPQNLRVANRNNNNPTNRNNNIGFRLSNMEIFSIACFQGSEYHEIFYLACCLACQKHQINPTLCCE